MVLTTLKILLITILGIYALFLLIALAAFIFTVIYELTHYNLPKR